MKKHHGTAHRDHEREAAALKDRKQRQREGTTAEGRAAERGGTSAALLAREAEILRQLGLGQEGTPPASTTDRSRR